MEVSDVSKNDRHLKPDLRAKKSYAWEESTQILFFLFFPPAACFCLFVTMETKREHQVAAAAAAAGNSRSVSVLR